MIKVKKKNVKMKPISSPDDVQHKVPQVVEDFTKIKHKEVFGKTAPVIDSSSVSPYQGKTPTKTPTKTKTKTKKKKT